MGVHVRFCFGLTSFQVLSSIFLEQVREKNGMDDAEVGSFSGCNRAMMEVRFLALRDIVNRVWW